MKLKTDHLYKIGDRVMYKNEVWTVTAVWGRSSFDYEICDDGGGATVKESELTPYKEPVKAYCYKCDDGTYLWCDGETEETNFRKRVPELDIVGGKSE